MLRSSRWLKQLTCALHGHEEFVCFEPHRISLRCIACGHQTAGWNLEHVDASAAHRLG